MPNEIDTASLTETVRAIMSKKRISYQALADALDLNDTTVWRAINLPLRASSRVLFQIVKYLQIPWDEFDRLFTRELDK